MRKTPSRVTVEVTEEDIARAKQNDSYNCVVAQAIARTVPTSTSIDVDTQSIRFTVDGERRIYMTPYAVQGYVIAFDAGDAIEPFSFQIRDPKRTKKRSQRGRDVPSTAATRARRAVRRAAGGNEQEPATAGVEAKASDAAKAAYAEARAAGATRPSSVSVSGRGKGPPRVWKKKRRSYGHRLLRINQRDDV